MSAASNAPTEICVKCIITLRDKYDLQELAARLEQYSKKIVNFKILSPFHLALFGPKEALERLVAAERLLVESHAFGPNEVHRVASE